MRKVDFIVLALLFLCSLTSQAQVFPLSITVSQDGKSDYKTIQEAVNAVRDLSPQTVKILIKRGVYREKVVVPSWKTNIHLIGEDKANTIITGGDYSGKDYRGSTDAFGNKKHSTYTSFTLLAQGDGFRAENLTIENTAGRVGQAVALHVESDRAVIINCRLLGNQDTLYAATGTSRQYYKDCYIEGTTDFIFGEATAVFSNCVIKSLSNSYITAAATTVAQDFGFVFFDCKLVADPTAGKVYLGRPWRPYAKTVFIRTEIGRHIVPEGWHAWPGDKMFPNKEKTAFYGEFGSYGPGVELKNRVAWSHRLSKRDIRKYTFKNIFSGSEAWIPQ
jgi:pectinesterase